MSVNPDLPGTRLNYDADGTDLYYRDQNGTLSLQTLTTKQTLNDDLASTSITPSIPAFATFGWVWVFPEARTISGYHISLESTGPYNHRLQYSLDTTNGTDGTWVTFATPTSFSEAGFAYNDNSWRTDFASITPIDNVKAVRYLFDRTGSGGTIINRFCAIHLYGAYPASGGDRVALWHPTLDQPLANVTSGEDQPAGTSRSFTFRVKNLSATLTANGVIVGSSVLTNPSGAIALTFNKGSGFAATQDIGALAPGAISSVLTGSLALPTTAALGAYNPRITAVPTSWS